MSPAPRPLSPHLQIYKPQLTTILSVSHRATGLVLAVGAVLVTWWLVAAASGDAAYAAAQAFWGSWFGVLLLMGWTFCLFYHLCNGIRHLAWDTGWGFDLKTAYLTGWIVVGASAALTILAWALGAIAWANA